jgi:hypothetical protein
VSRDFPLAVIAAGVVLAVVGLVVLLAARFPVVPFGRLPGDLHWQRRGVAVWVPITTCLLLSALLTLLLRSLRR